jgi:putative flippase GtrA
MQLQQLRLALRGELFRQLFLYGVVGGAQLLVDYLTFVMLTSLGITIVLANLAGRIVGATLGYFLNRRLTFARLVVEGQRESTMMIRFAAVWIGLTILGTVIVGSLGQMLTLQAIWIAKPLVDAALAVVGFLLSRLWIYR